MWYGICFVIGYLLGIITPVAGYLYFSRSSVDKAILAERLKEIENL